jgi:hypothetical protein
MDVQALSTLPMSSIVNAILKILVYEEEIIFDKSNRILHNNHQMNLWVIYVMLFSIGFYAI